MHGLDQRNFRAVKALKARVPKLEEAQFGQAEPSRFSKHNIGDEVLAQHPNVCEIAVSSHRRCFHTQIYTVKPNGAV